MFSHRLPSRSAIPALAPINPSRALGVSIAPKVYTYLLSAASRPPISSLSSISRRPGLARTTASLYRIGSSMFSLWVWRARIPRGLPCWLTLLRELCYADAHLLGRNESTGALCWALAVAARVREARIVTRGWDEAGEGVFGARMLSFSFRTGNVDDYPSVGSWISTYFNLLPSLTHFYCPLNIVFTSDVTTSSIFT